jgi:hypothetical protein
MGQIVMGQIVSFSSLLGTSDFIPAIYFLAPQRFNLPLPMTSFCAMINKETDSVED